MSAFITPRSSVQETGPIDDASSASGNRSQRTQALRRELIAGLKNGVLLAFACAALGLPPARSSALTDPPGAGTQSAPSGTLSPVPGLHADFDHVYASPDAHWIADWVATSGDNHRLPFAILDKRGARAYVFDASARLVGSSLVLFGSAAGDDSVAGIGDRRLADLRPEERTTAAGRFVSEPGHDDTGDSVIWVDYDAALAMHRVKVIDPKEHRLQRIATPSIEDKHITNGCINVPVDFFDSVVQPWLGHSPAIVYVLPQTKPVAQVFPNAYAVATQ
jgi:hypothetical protein